MSYIPEDSRARHQSKDGKEGRVFDALEWPAATRLPKMFGENKDNQRDRRQGDH